MKYQIDISDIIEKNIYELSSDFSGKNLKQEELSFTNYYMEKNKKPLFGVSGEFHFSRMSPLRWEDEIIKMKMGGIQTVVTYVFWIHHEEKEGIFDFSGQRDVRAFIELCKKHEMYMILRIGPFDHGEVRNGGIPDWMYGKPFDLRACNEGFLYYTKCLYQRIAEEIKGLFYSENGPIIGVQIDNEYMHSSAPWEITRGISDEWVTTGDEGESYMLHLKDLAYECGIRPVFYTCTGWGKAPTPDNMLPLWGGYAFRPWLFYTDRGEHPSTEEYIYQDFHKNGIICTNDFKPFYQPEEKPYACCEMGGGMSCSYKYRFLLPYKSVDAMANIKIASGCNFVGYYMFQGGTNPLGKHGEFMNESQVPKMSYDYQAALGEYGQVRESYRRLKSIHYFGRTFQEELCKLQTVLPQNAQQILPTDLSTLRYAIRTDGKKGFLFINNYQDHEIMPKRQMESICIHARDEEICFHELSLDAEENCILPFHMDLSGIDLIKASAQPITRIREVENDTYFFFIPDGMKGQFEFEKGVFVNEKELSTYDCQMDQEIHSFVVQKEGLKVKIIYMSRTMANQMFLLHENKVVFTNEVILEENDMLRIESETSSCKLYTYPSHVFDKVKNAKKISLQSDELGIYEFQTKQKEIKIQLKEVGKNRYTIDFQKEMLSDIKDARLIIKYQGDIGSAFINGRMISDNFYNGTAWEIGLLEHAKELEKHPITIYINPQKIGAKVNVESAMAARKEEMEDSIGKIVEVSVLPIYEIKCETPSCPM